MRTSIAVLSALLAAQAPSAWGEPAAYQPPRHANGRPNFEGIWTNTNSTPLVRPSGHTQLFVSEAEARERAEAEARAERIATQAEAAYEERVALGRERGRELIAEAEIKRAEVLRQLARTRQLAQLNLEQLRVGRERLLTAYEVAKATIDQATGELDKSLPEAKALAERLTARVGDDETRSLQELEAEFALERLEDLRILADDDPGARVSPRPKADRYPPPDAEAASEAEEVSASMAESIPTEDRPTAKVFDMEAAEAEAQAEAEVVVPATDGLDGDDEGDADDADENVLDLTDETGDADENVLDLADETATAETAEDPAPTSR